MIIGGHLSGNWFQRHTLDIRMMHILFASVSAFLTLIGSMLPARRGAMASEQGQCTVTAHPSRALLVGDSRVVMNATTLSHDGAQTLILGTQLLMIGPDGTGELVESVGILRDTSGHATLVPAPLANTAFIQFRSVADERTGWHVIFATPAAMPQRPTPTLWYARFDGRRWRDLAQLGPLLGANVSARAASEPLLVGKRVHFAYTFDRAVELKSNATGNQGAVMLTRSGQRWRYDTLHTWEGPRSVKLGRGSGPHIIAILAKSYFESARPHGPALFIATYDSTWSTPRLLQNPDPLYVSEVISAPSTASGRGLMWRIAVKGRMRPERIAWGVIDGDSVRVLSAIRGVHPIDVPAVLPIGRSQSLVAIRSDSSQSRVEIRIASADSLYTAGTFDIPIMTYSILGSRIDSTRALLLTGGVDPAASSEPRVSTFLTELTVKCRVTH